MGKRGRRRRDEAQEITRPEQGETYRQYSQQQQTRAPPIGSERVKMMKLEARLNAASSLQAALSPPPVKLFSSTFFCVHILFFWFRENKGFVL